MNKSLQKLAMRQSKLRRISRKLDDLLEKDRENSGKHSDKVNKYRQVWRAHKHQEEYKLKSSFARSKRSLFDRKRDIKRKLGIPENWHISRQGLLEHMRDRSNGRKSSLGFDNPTPPISTQTTVKPEKFRAGKAGKLIGVGLLAGGLYHATRRHKERNINNSKN